MWCDKMIEYKEEDGGDGDEDGDDDGDEEPLVVQRADGTLGSRRHRLLLVLHLESDWLPNPP